MRSCSRWYGSNLVALVMGKVRGMSSASGSALVNHLLQQGLGHGARRHEDSAGCCAVSSFSCWCTACSRVRGRGHGSNSCGPNLMVEGCTHTKQTFWTEDEFTVTVSSGIRNRDVRVAEIVARELEKAKPDKWGCV
jgi:hypothetical protein